MIHFYDVCPEFLLRWPFSNGFAFQKRSCVIPKHVIRWKESLMTLKERDFLAVLKPKCISVIYTYWTIQSSVDTPIGKFALCKIIRD
jgi:hypothetical protein